MTAQPAFADLEPSIVQNSTDADAGEGVLTGTRLCASSMAEHAESLVLMIK